MSYSGITIFWEVFLTVLPLVYVYSNLITQPLVIVKVFV